MKCAVLTYISSLERGSIALSLSQRSIEHATYRLSHEASAPPSPSVLVHKTTCSPVGLLDLLFLLVSFACPSAQPTPPQPEADIRHHNGRQ